MIDSSNAYQGLRTDMGSLRAELRKLEAMNIAGVFIVTANMRVIMTGMASRVTELEGNEAARRMCGQVAPLAAQAPIEELPIFAGRVSAGHALTVEEIEAMERSLHRAGDRTQDRDDLNDLNDDGEGVR